jgi:hypothetical protein
MSAVHGIRSMRRPGRIARVLGYEGPVAGLVLGTFGCFLASVSFLASLLPTIAFQALVGWQSTHLAIWLGALSLITVFPAVRALIVSATAMLDEGMAAARTGRRYWRTFAATLRDLWWATVILPVMAVVLGYDLALMGSSDTVFLIVVAAVLATVVFLIGLASSTPTRGESTAAVELVARTAVAVVRRPHVALAWLLIAALTAAAMFLPVLGALAVLLLPAVSAMGIVVCNRALGYSRTAPEVRR